MPHVVLEGPVTPEDIWLSFRPLEFHENGAHSKATECFLSSDRKSALVRSLVVERDFPKSFMLKMALRDGGLTVGLEPMGSPERTAAVKRFIGFCAWRIMQAEPQMRVVRGNILDLVGGPKEP